MNKEVKAIVEYLEEEREAIRKKHYYPDDVLNSEDLIMLMDYINQLETNRDEAIKSIKEQMKYLENVKEFYSDEQDFKDMCFPIINSNWSYCDDMLKILERGKE